MASGVQVEDECQTAFLDVKKSKKYRYIIFYIRDEKIIAIEKYGPRDSSYDDFLEQLTGIGPDDCRYALYDMEYEHKCQGASDTQKKQKLFLMSWCPDTAKIKKKMLYSSSFDALKSAFTGIGKFIQATDMTEASFEAVMEKLKATDRS